jgi:streptogramin lyase
MAANNSSSSMVQAGLALAGITCMVLGPAARPALADTPVPPGGHIAATIPDPASPVGVEAGFGSVWVADQTNSAILRVAPN